MIYSHEILKRYVCLRLIQLYLVTSGKYIVSILVKLQGYLDYNKALNDNVWRGIKSTDVLQCTQKFSNDSKTLFNLPLKFLDIMTVTCLNWLDYLDLASIGCLWSCVIHTFIL